MSIGAWIGLVGAYGDGIKIYQDAHRGALLITNTCLDDHAQMRKTPDMSESQIIKKVAPNISVSSMDTHKILSNGTPRPGTRPPLRPLAGPVESSPGVQLRQAPMDVQMKGSNTVVVSSPPRVAVRPAQAGHRRAVQAPAPPVTPSVGQTSTEPVGQMAVGTPVQSEPQVESSSTETIITNGIPFTIEQATFCAKAIDARLADTPESERALAISTMQALIAFIQA